MAQGQANRAQELRHAITVYRQLPLPAAGRAVGLASLVTIEAGDGCRKVLFLGPLEGGLKIAGSPDDIMVITPTSPLGRELLGKRAGDTAEITAGARRIEYEIVEVD